MTFNQNLPTKIFLSILILVFSASQCRAATKKNLKKDLDQCNILVNKLDSLLQLAQNSNKCVQLVYPAAPTKQDVKLARIEADKEIELAKQAAKTEIKTTRTTTRAEIQNNKIDEKGKTERNAILIFFNFATKSVNRLFSLLIGALLTGAIAPALFKKILDWLPWKIPFLSAE